MVRCLSLYLIQSRTAVLGSALGAFYAGKIADRYGRVKAMVVASILFTISAIGSGFAFTIWDFIFWRVLGGIAVGAASVIAPAYIAECSPAKRKTRFFTATSNCRRNIHCFIMRLLYCSVRRFGGSTLFIWNRRLALDVLDRNTSRYSLWNGCIDDS